MCFTFSIAFYSKLLLYNDLGGYNAESLSAFLRMMRIFIMNVKTEEEAYNIAYFLSVYGFTYYFDDMTGKHILRHNT